MGRADGWKGLGRSEFCGSPLECLRSESFTSVEFTGPRRAFIDTDPLFTQVRHLTDRARMRNALNHTVFFTFGENVSREDCSIPDDGLPWIPTRQPIVMDAWPVRPGKPDGNFTTVMHWDSYPPVSYKAKTYGMKSASFTEYFDLPRATGERMELVVAGAAVPRDHLLDHGWQLTASHDVVSGPFSYQRFVSGSKAEFSVAKHGYVCSRTGWFSERSAAYLASGRPVVTHNTGFTDWLQADGGVLPFDSCESATDAIRRVSGDYARHCRLAREVAAEYFDSGRVLKALLENATSERADGTRSEGQATALSDMATKQREATPLHR